jgi:hypothetical protein
LRVKWENESEADNNYYFSQNLREVKSLDSFLRKGLSHRVNERETKIGRRILKHEIKKIRYMRPEIQDSELNKALEQSSESTQPTEFVLNRFVDNSHRSKGLMPGQSISNDVDCYETEWVDMESEISDSENTEDTDRSKRHINVDAVNYQVSTDCSLV